MKLIFPKRKYTYSQAIAYAAETYGEKNIIKVIDAGDKELNHIVEVI